MPILAQAATYDIAVLAANDKVFYRDWGRYGNDTWTNVGANPNEVSHTYSYDWYAGHSANANLSFDLSSFSAPLESLESVSLNFNVLSIWSDDGRDVVSNLDSGGSVLKSEGIGWKSLDVTKSIVAALNNGASAAGFTFSYTGYSGFTFGSAEGNQPAFLRITTNEPNAVPIPAGIWLMGSGLLGLLGFRRKFVN